MRASPPAHPAPAGLYLHFPFCSVRCSYCDFPTVAGRDDRIDAYLDALEREIACGQPGMPRDVDTIYLGGGTPSRMQPRQVGRLLDATRRRFRVAPGAEITLEGNPESLTREHLEGYRDAGVTRISVGVQSLDDDVLRATGRAHDGSGARDAVARARAVEGIRVNVDLIAGLPGEHLERWEAGVNAVVDLEPDHVSVYLLETDKDAPLARAVRCGRVRVADDDAMADVYRSTVRVLESGGLAAYEISNFARPGCVSRHNLKYWTDAPFGGFGLGAHAYFEGARRGNRRDLDGYLADVAAGRDPVAWEEPWDPERRLAEAVILGLRTVAGIDPDALGERYGVDLRRHHASVWERARAAGLVEESPGRLALTLRGRLRSNELFAELI